MSRPGKSVQTAFMIAAVNCSAVARTKLLAQIAVQIFLHQPATINVSYVVAKAPKP